MTTENQKTYKILALDGGGFRGVMTAQILVAVEEEIKKKYSCALHEYFDLVTGTSTGSILATGIALGKSATDMLKLYKDNGDRIFPRWQRIRRRFRGLLTSAGLYNSKKGLGPVLKDKFGQLAINRLSDEIPDAPVLLIPAYNLTERYTTWFCSNNPKNSPSWFDEIPIWQICTCSSSAPTFFPPFHLSGQGRRITRKGTIDPINYNYFFFDSYTHKNRKKYGSEESDR